ncbi:hypothetical protein [Streptomyces sp. NPDC090112]|uniref:hypothetical protein n=1 Tax=Streptomyces sp. NPDC090112 TaxID=3365949 RepID=UPI0037FC75D2
MEYDLRVSLANFTCKKPASLDVMHVRANSDVNGTEESFQELDFGFYSIPADSSIERPILLMARRGLKSEDVIHFGWYFASGYATEEPADPEPEYFEYYRESAVAEFGSLAHSGTISGTNSMGEEFEYTYELAVQLTPVNA